MTSQWQRWIPWIGFCLALGLRLWNLGIPAGLMSDEVYFVQDAQHYATHTAYLDAHPPLGKLQIAAAIALFGNHPLVWRLPGAIEGALMIPLLWWLGLVLTKNVRVAAAAMLLGLLDGMMLVDSRSGMINIPYLVAGFCAVGCILRALASRRPNFWLLAGGLAIGAAVSVKWLALLIILPGVVAWIVPGWFGFQRLQPFGLQLRWWSVIALGVVPLLVYGAVWQIHYRWLGIPDDTLRTNVFLLAYHLQGMTGHVYREFWWGWPILRQPFPYWTSGTPQYGTEVWTLGNPWVWWTALPLLAIGGKTAWRMTGFRFALALLATSWLPFAFIRRDMFLYHALPFGISLILALAMLNGVWWPRFRPYVIVYVVMTISVFFWFLPWFLNIPLSEREHNLRRWLPTWKIRAVATPKPDATAPAAPR